MAADDEPQAAGPTPDAGTAAACRGCGCVDRDDAAPEAVPGWREQLAEAQASRIDVRPMLAAGEPPMAAVLHAAEGVPAGNVLVIEAPFDPRPLRRVLAGKGFATYAERLGAGHWQVWCRRRGGGEEPVREADGLPAEAQTWRAGDVVHIDVRGLGAPRPLVAILALIDGGNHAGHVVVHHDREPLYLYPELEERGWTYAPLASPEGEVRLDLRGPR